MLEKLDRDMQIVKAWIEGYCHGLTKAIEIIKENKPQEETKIEVSEELKDLLCGHNKPGLVIRNVCQSCYSRYCKMIQAGTVTWEDLELAGKVAKSKAIIKTDV